MSRYNPTIQLALSDKFAGAFATHDGDGVTQLHLPGITDDNCPRMDARTLDARINEAVGEEIEIFERTRKDADEDPDIRSLLFRASLRSARESWADKSRADAKSERETRKRFYRGAVAGMRLIADVPTKREDANTYYENSLNQQIGSPIAYPLRNLADVLSGIPVRMVSPGIETYERRYVKGYGNAGVHRPGVTSLTYTGITRSAAKRPLQTFTVGVLDDWLLRMHDGYSGLSNQADNVRQAGRALDELWHGALLAGIDGLDMFSLADIPLLRRRSSIVIGTDAIDTVYADFMDALSAASESSESGAVMDTVIISERILNRLMAYSNWLAGGGTANGSALLAQAFSDRGIRRVIVGKSMRNLGGTNIDGALFFATGEETGLAQVIGMRAAPVHRFTGPNGDVTVYAMRVGGLELPIAENAFLYLVEVTP